MTCIGPLMTLDILRYLLPIAFWKYFDAPESNVDLKPLISPFWQDMQKVLTEKLVTPGNNLLLDNFRDQDQDSGVHKTIGFRLTNKKSK